MERLGERCAVLSDLDEVPWRLARVIEMRNIPRVLAVVPTFSAIGIYFESGFTLDVLKEWEQFGIAAQDNISQQTFVIPVCYEMELDLDRVSERLNISREKVLEFHLGKEVTCYSVGFCPGFAYCGPLAPEISQVSRLPSPRPKIEAGSVGIYGENSAVYPIVRPGGWNIIGQTPLILVDVEDNFFPIRPGAKIRYERIDEAEFRKLKGNRLVEID